MNYRDTRFWENFNIEQFPTVGEYSIPALEPYIYEPAEFIGFNFARSAKNKKEKGLHFFVDDYQFERLWREPLKYINLIGEFHSIMTPDFSLYTDFPKALQIYNHYRKMWLGALWQSYGFKIIPTVAWSDKNSFEWCFDGMPKGGTVAVSSVGTQKSKETKQAFLDGWNEMLWRLEPETVYSTEMCRKNAMQTLYGLKHFKKDLRRLKQIMGGRGSASGIGGGSNLKAIENGIKSSDWWQDAERYTRNAQKLKESPYFMGNLKNEIGTMAFMRDYEITIKQVDRLAEKMISDLDKKKRKK